MRQACMDMPHTWTFPFEFSVSHILSMIWSVYKIQSSTMSLGIGIVLQEEVTDEVYSDQAHCWPYCVLLGISSLQDSIWTEGLSDRILT